MRTRPAVHVHGFVPLLLAALLFAPLAIHAGGQGVTLPAVAPPTDTELHRFLMNEPGVPVPRFVCVDDPTIECFELAQDPAYSNAGAPTRMTSPCLAHGPDNGTMSPSLTVSWALAASPDALMTSAISKLAGRRKTFIPVIIPFLRAMRTIR